MFAHDATIAAPDTTRSYSRALMAFVALAGGLAFGLWLLGTPPGILGKADAIGYAVCHRIAERSFHTYGRALPLCARCAGTYLGALVGLLLVAGRGRARAGRLPGVRVLAVMVALGVVYAFDGLNSYLSLFEFYTPLYPPHNTLRLLTGATFGLALILVALPAFNTIAWRDPLPEAPARNLRELAALYGAAGLGCVAMLIDLPALRAVLGVLGAVGVVFMFVLIGCAAFLIVAGRENSVTRWRDLAFPALAGLTFAISVIGVIDFARYLVTGTWSGFAL
jgi:uncharacterized membrane protein